MTQFQKMVLISQATYDEMKYAAPTHQPNPMEQILHQPGISDESIQRQYINAFAPKQIHAPTITHEPKDNITKWIELVPLTFKRQAKYIIQQLQKVIDWDSNTGTVQVDNKPLHGSNIVDILNYIVRQRKTVKPPEGWSQLLPIIESLNLPREIAPNYYVTRSVKRDLDTLQDIDEPEHKLSKPWIKS